MHDKWTPKDLCGEANEDWGNSGKKKINIIKDLTEDSSAFNPLIYKFNVFHFSVYTVIYLLQIWRFCILFSFQLHGLHKIFPFLWGILFIFFPPFHFFPCPVSFFLSGNMWCRLVKSKTSFSFIYLGERGLKCHVNSHKKVLSRSPRMTNNTLIDQTD